MSTEPEAVRSDAAGGRTKRPSALQDPILRLAVALYHGKGAYALLLGSGVSRSAGIPTGWEIVLDLVRQLAASVGEPCEQGGEVAWYINKFGTEPTYDRLLDQVTARKFLRAWERSRYRRHP